MSTGSDESDSSSSGSSGVLPPTSADGSSDGSSGGSTTDPIVLPTLGRWWNTSDSQGGCGHGPNLVQALSIVSADMTAIEIAGGGGLGPSVPCPRSTEFPGFDCPPLPLEHPGAGTSYPAGTTLTAHAQVQFETPTSSLGQIVYTTDCEGDCDGAPELPCEVTVISMGSFTEGEEALLHDCADLPNLAGSGSGEATYLEVHNDTPELVQQRFVDASGTLSDPWEIRPGGVAEFNTVEGGIFTIEDGNGTCLGVYEIVPGWNVIAVQ